MYALRTYFLYCVFRIYFLVFSQMLSIIVKEWKFCCIRFRFLCCESSQFLPFGKMALALQNAI